MKTFTIIILLILSYSHALERGKDYFRDKVCQEFNTLGKDKFRAISIILNSRKYSSATFEEITNIVNEIVALGEKCCPEGSDPECYTTESSALSAKSCDPNAPFPKHPGTAACCTEEGLAQKLCLAALKHPPKELFTYVEPQNDELCEAFKKDPRDFTDRFLYEYSTDHSHTPLPLLLNSTTTYLSMIQTCCHHQQPTLCFLKERLEGRSLRKLADISNKECSRYALFDKEKTKLSYLIAFTQKCPNAPFEDVLSLAENTVDLLSKCCENDCRQDEGLRTIHTTNICNTLSTYNERIKKCCLCTTAQDIYVCIYHLPWDKQVDDSHYTGETGEAFCGEDRQRKIFQKIHHLAQFFTRAPEALLITHYDISQEVANACCSDPDSHACLALKSPEKTAELIDLLSKANTLCSDYTDHTFLEFKETLREKYRKLLSTATDDAISALVEQKATFASNCCLLNAPPSYCGLKVKDEVVRQCTDDHCVKH